MTQFNNYGITKNNLATSSGILINTNNLADVRDAAMSNQNLFTDSIINATATGNAIVLDSSAYGAQTFVYNATGDFTVTLPEPDPLGPYIVTLMNISFGSHETEYGTATLLPAHEAGRINALSSVYLAPGDSLKLMHNSDHDWFIVDEFLNPAQTIVGVTVDQQLLSNQAAAVNFNLTYGNVGGFGTDGYSSVYPHETARVATTEPLDATYNNGASGVGATLTANVNGAIIVDGVTLTAGDRILNKDSMLGDEPQAGIYEVTTEGDVSNPYVLTRTTDFDEDGDSEVAYGAFLEISQGDINAGLSFIQTNPGPFVMGTTNIVFSAYAPYRYTPPAGLYSLEAQVAIDYTGMTGDDTISLFIARTSGATTHIAAANGKAISDADTEKLAFITLNTQVNLFPGESLSLVVSRGESSTGAVLITHNSANTYFATNFQATRLNRYATQFNQG